MFGVDDWFALFLIAVGARCQMAAALFTIKISG
jgi:hypothetical protein